MKNFLVIAMLAVGLTGCLSGDDSDNGGNPECPVEIKLKAGVYDITTKAPVNAGSSVTAGFVASLVNGDYTTNTWTNVSATFTASIAASSSFSFSPAQFYPVNDSILYVKGYYPVGTVSGKTVTFSTNDGTNDVMISNQASSRKTTGSTPLAFTFNHLLTQLQFQFVAGSGYPMNLNVTNLTVKAQQVPASLDLNTGTVTYNNSNVSITGSFPITSSPGTPATSYLMVKPGVTVILSITTSDGVTYADKTLTLTTEVATSHLITVTFSPVGITATAAVTAWNPGGAGNATVS